MCTKGPKFFTYIRQDILQLINLVLFAGLVADQNYKLQSQKKNIKTTVSMIPTL